MMFSGFRSAWIKPRDFSFFKAIATYKDLYKIGRGHVKPQQNMISCVSASGKKNVSACMCYIHVHHFTCCRIGLMILSGSGLNLFCLRKSYRFCSSISNTKQVWLRCWKHSRARTTLCSSAFSLLNRARISTWGVQEHRRKKPPKKQLQFRQSGVKKIQNKALADRQFFSIYKDQTLPLL